MGWQGGAGGKGREGSGSALKVWFSVGEVGPRDLGVACGQNSARLLPLLLLLLLDYYYNYC